MKKLLTLLTLLTFNVFANEPSLSYVGFKNDFPAVGQQTWYYTVESGTKPSISHVSLAICLTQYGVVAAGTWGPSLEDLTPADPSTYETGVDPTTGIDGLKFDEGMEDGEVRKIYFTIDFLAEADQIEYAIKSGLNIKTGLITGPTCDGNVGPKPCNPIYKDPAVIKWNPKYEQKYGAGSVYFSIHGQVIPCTLSKEYDINTVAFKATLQNAADGTFYTLEVPAGGFTTRNNKTWNYKDSKFKVVINKKLYKTYTTYAVKIKSYLPILSLTSLQQIETRLHFDNEYHFLTADWLGTIGRKVKLPNKYFKQLPQ
jgi:hypothetical protein